MASATRRAGLPPAAASAALVVADQPSTDSRWATASGREPAGSSAIADRSAAVAAAAANFTRTLVAAVVSHAAPDGQPPTLGGANGTWPSPVSAVSTDFWVSKPGPGLASVAFPAPSADAGATRRP